MSTLYRPLHELMYALPWFRRAAPTHQLVAITLAAGPCASGCPGLTRADVYTIMSHHPTLGIEAAEAALLELVRVGAIEVAEEHGLVRLPWLPAMRATASDKTLRGWWACWRELPDCELRQRHVADLQPAIELRGKGMAAAWAETFGSLTKPSRSPSVGHHEGMGSPGTALPMGCAPGDETPSDHGDGDGDGDGEDEPPAAPPPSDDPVEWGDPDSAPAALKLVVPAPKASKPRASAPLPFKPDEALAAVERASRGAFVASKLDQGHAVAVTKLIRRYPEPSTWERVGTWLPVGADAWKLKHGPLDVRALIASFDAWAAQASAWSEQRSRGSKRPTTGAARPADDVLDEALPGGLR